MRKETKTTEPANTDRKCQDCKLLPFLVEFFFGVEVIFAIRLRATWMVDYKNSNGDIYSVYWQFSLKDPWLLPKYDPNFCSGSRKGRVGCCRIYPCRGKRQTDPYKKFVENFTFL